MDAASLIDKLMDLCKSLDCNVWLSSDEVGEIIMGPLGEVTVLPSGDICLSPRQQTDEEIKRENQ